MSDLVFYRIRPGAMTCSPYRTTFSQEIEIRGYECLTKIRSDRSLLELWGKNP